MDQKTLDTFNALLQARDEVLAFVIVLSLIFAVVLIVRLIVPLIAQGNAIHAKTSETLSFMQQGQSGLRNAIDDQQQQLAQLRTEFRAMNETVLNIQIKLDELPQKMQKEILAALGGSPPRSGLWKRLFGTY